MFTPPTDAEASINGFSPPRDDPEPRDVSLLPISAFKSFKTALPQSPTTVSEWVTCIRDGGHAESVATVRAARGTDHYDKLKGKLPAVTWAGTFPEGRKGKTPTEPTGIVFLEVDDHEGARPSGWLADEKTRLAAYPSTVAVYLSCGGAGLHAIVSVSPSPTTKAAYRSAWTAALSQLELTEKADPATKDIARLALVSHDPDAYMNLNPIPLAWEPTQKKTATTRPSRPDSTAHGPGTGTVTERDIEDLSRLPVPDSYNDWLGWLAVLKAAGFTLQQVEGWSSGGPKYTAGEVSEKWDSLPSDPPPIASRRFRAAVGRHDDHPIRRFTQPGFDNLTDAANFGRLLAFHSGRLVIALPGPQEGPESLADIYGIDGRGMLSPVTFAAAVLDTGSRYLLEANLLDDTAEFKAAAGHARKLRNAGATEKLRMIAAGTITELRANGALPDDLVIKAKNDVDSDMSVIGTPRGVVDLNSGEILPPDKARNSFVLSSTEVDYDPEAQHDRLDEIMPPVAALVPDSIAYYRARILSFGMTHVPQREFLWEVCARGSGKSSFFNALRQGLGGTYIQTIRKEALQSPKYLGGATAHNGDLRRFKAPARFVFAMEWSHHYDSDLVKKLSGGDRVTMRRIAMEDEDFQPTGHLWIMGNSRAGSDSPALGIAEDDEDSGAIMDRAKMLNRERIPDELQVKDVVTLHMPEFKRAALARIVDYCKAYGELEFPSTVPSLAGLLEQQREMEAPQWKRDWLPNVLVEIDKGDSSLHGQVEAHNKLVYADFLGWWEEFGEGKPPSPKAVGGAVCDYYGVRRVETKIMDPDYPGIARWTKAYIYLGWRLRD